MSYKNCQMCGKEFKKGSTISRRAWERTRFCSHPCYAKSKVGAGVAFWKGKKLPEDVKRKISETCKRNGIAPSDAAREKAKRFGEANNKWKGGITPINVRLRNKLRENKEYRLWRKAVFERDNFTCTMCNAKDKTLNADHIKSFSLFPELRYAIDNGRTLCVFCHRKTDTYGKGSVKVPRDLKIFRGLGMTFGA